MKLAAHLCGSRVDEVLGGDDSFLSKLPALGFRRFQINATAVNGANTSNMEGSVLTLARLMARHPQLEFILQKNEETQPLWEGLLNGGGEGFGPPGGLPENVTMLIDESKGTGVLPSSWPAPPDQYNIGYAGGIGPDNVADTLGKLMKGAKGRDIWIDMESSLRSHKNRVDMFDVDKCYQCIETVCDMKLGSHPEYLR